MAITLIINPGSSSKKYSLFNDGRLVLSVRYERQDDVVEVCVTTTAGQQKCEFVSDVTYKNALVDMLKRAVMLKALTVTKDITAVGVRTVVPGTFFQKHQVADKHFVTVLRERQDSAPLHIPPTLYEIEQVQIELPGVTVVSVSDSAFHSSLSVVARRYSIPQVDMDEYDVQRFGYHGISVSSVLRVVPHIIGDKKRMVICHVGSGISLTAISGNQSVDTTMGYSPLSGMMMGTRAGDIEPGALMEVMRQKQYTIQEAYRYFSSECGIKGVSGQADIRTVMQRAKSGDEKSKLALTILQNHFQKKLASMMVSLGGCDAIIYTGTAAERNGELRQHLLSGLDWLGISLDEKRNSELIGGNGLITSSDVPITIAVIKTSEDVEMARIVNCFVK